MIFHVVYPKTYQWRDMSIATTTATNVMWFSVFCTPGTHLYIDGSAAYRARRGAYHKHDVGKYRITQKRARTRFDVVCGWRNV